MNKRIDRDSQLRDNETRIPAGAPRMKLTIRNPDPDKRYYWAEEDQLTEMQQAGYSFTRKGKIQVGDARTEGTDLGAMITEVADRSTGEKLYLMEIDKEVYEDNQRIKQAQILETENTINQNDPPGQGEFYIPGKNKVRRE